MHCWLEKWISLSWVSFAVLCTSVCRWLSLLYILSVCHLASGPSLSNERFHSRFLWPSSLVTVWRGRCSRRWCCIGSKRSSEFHRKAETCCCGADLKWLRRKRLEVCRFLTWCFVQKFHCKLWFAHQPRMWHSFRHFGLCRSSHLKLRGCSWLAVEWTLVSAALQDQT